MKPVQEKTASILIADPIASTRLMMSSVLRALGFSRVVAVASLAEALTILGKDQVDWLIASFYADSDVNILHLLTIAREHSALENLKVSVFAQEAEERFLPRAFALGLLSAHRRPFNKIEFTTAMEDVLVVTDREAGHATMVASNYLRTFLRREQRAEELIRFEGELARAFPEVPKLLLNLADAAFEAGDDRRGRALLWQAEQRDPALAAAAKELGDQHLGAIGADSSRAWENVKPGICVVVDPDESARNATRDALAETKPKAVHVFTDGEEAWSWLRTVKGAEAPDLVVMEWRTTKVSGPALLQRMRAHGLHLPLVIVNSSLVKKADAPILLEMGVTTILEKPSGRNELLNCIAWIIEQARRPTEGATLDSRIRAMLSAGQVERASELMQIVLAKASPDDPNVRYLQGEFAYALGDFAGARDYALASLQGAKSVLALNLLGKALMKLREFDKATQVFERANEISPSSLERLCAMAESLSETGNDDAARATLEKATKIDAEHQSVVNATVNIGLATGDAAMVKDVFDKMRPSESILSYVNNRAVAFSKQMNFRESIALYGKALDAIPADRQHLRAIVLYNLALAQIQDEGSGLKVAAETLRAVDLQTLPPQVVLKVSSLLERAEDALRKGETLKLNQSDAKAAIQLPTLPPKSQKMLEKIAPGRKVAVMAHCVHGLFVDTPTDDPLLEALLQNAPRFTSSRR